MLYIHDSSCISPQQTFANDKLFELSKDELNLSDNNILYAVEPAYEGIPPAVLRRMGRAVRLGVGAAIPLLKKNENNIDGVVIGTSMGGMEDCVKFLYQVIEYNEGTLTPTNFVQSTPNAIAGQVGLLSKNKGYNITHVHRGFSFENAVIDVGMSLAEYPRNTYLLGAVDEISVRNHNIERLDGWYKDEASTNLMLYQTDSKGTLAGEGAAMFLVNDQPANALAHLKAVHIFQCEDVSLVAEQLAHFLLQHFAEDEKPDLLLSGENGDNRFIHFYEVVEQMLGNDVTIARFKQLGGEYPTASAFGCWIACEVLRKGTVPVHMIKRQRNAGLKKIIVYNNYKGVQHSFMLLQQS